jgi:hypothetical protein
LRSVLNSTPGSKKDGRQCRFHDLSFVLRMETQMDRLHPAVRIRSSQIELLGNVLTRAFYNDPRAAYIFPDELARRAVLSWFLASVAIRASRLCGEIYTTANVEGGALWIRPGVELTIGHAVRTEMPSLPFKLDRPSIIRWITVDRYLESIRKHMADEPYWYLLALGTAPSLPGSAIRRALIAPVLATADWDRRPCYVETFNEKDLPFYEQSGFQIAGAGQIPNDGPGFWTLIRPPRRVVKPRCTDYAAKGAPVAAARG